MLKILYQDPAIVVCEKPFRVLSTDEPGGMPDCIRQALGRPEAEVRTVPPAGPGGGRAHGLRPHPPGGLGPLPPDPGGPILKGVPGGDPLASPGRRRAPSWTCWAATPRPERPMWPNSPAKASSRPSSTTEWWTAARGSPWCPSGWRPGGPIRSGPSSPPGALPLAGDRKYSKYPDTPGVADRPVVPPPGLYPPGDRPGHGFPFGSPWGGGLGALLPPVREKDRAGPAPVQTCNVVSRPVPGGGSRLSLEKARTQRVAGVTPRPPALRAARSHSLVLAVVVHCFGRWAITSPMYVP